MLSLLPCTQFMYGHLMVLPHEQYTTLDATNQHPENAIQLYTEVSVWEGSGGQSPGHPINYLLLDMLESTLYIVSKCRPSNIWRSSRGQKIVYYFHSARQQSYMRVWELCEWNYLTLIALQEGSQITIQIFIAPALAYHHVGSDREV